MLTVFYIASAIAVVSTIMVITRHNIIHALMYLVVSFLAIAVIFYVLGASFMAALEVIVYAGAIVVLIIFVIMMLNLRAESVDEEREWMKGGIIVGPALLSIVLFGELFYLISTMGMAGLEYHSVDAKAVGMSLYGPYVIGVELSGILLMSGIVGAYHLGRQKKKIVHRFLEKVEE
jgi:NADH-quinone oxidoreductase subunit J